MPHSSASDLRRPEMSQSGGSRSLRRVAQPCDSGIVAGAPRFFRMFDEVAPSNQRVIGLG
jgi:hypothetical protein